MKLIDAKEIQLIDKVKSDIETYGIPQVYANIYSEGFNAAEKQLKPLFIEFAEFYHTVADLEKTYYGRDCKRLFDLWIEEQTKR